VHFQNRNTLSIASQGELLLSTDSGHLQLIARLQRGDHVARVLDREATATPVAAARAAIVIRSQAGTNS